MEIKPLTENLFDVYIEVGKKAYDQHYLHLWQNQDASPYHESSFTHDVLQKEAKDDNTELFIIYYQGKSAGILKIIKNSEIHPYSEEEALLLEKIYILKKYTGKSIGKEVLKFTEQKARELRKKVMWLDTMLKGRALHFYLANNFEIHSETKLHFKGIIECERPMYQLVKTL